MDDDRLTDFIHSAMDYLNTPEGKAVTESDRVEFFITGAMIIALMLPLPMWQKENFRIVYLLGYLDGMRSEQDIDLSAFDDFVNDNLDF